MEAKINKEGETTLEATAATDLNPTFNTGYILGAPIDLETEKVMASHSSTLAWQIPWAEEPGRLQSMGSLRVGHD